MPSMEFGNRLKELRRERDISLRQLAKMLDITPAYLSRIENGHENPPTAAIISRMALLLEVDESELFGLVPKDLRYQRIPDEIIEGYQKNKANTKKIPEFFRKVNETELTEEDWDRIIANIKSRSKE